MIGPNVSFNPVNQMEMPEMADNCYYECKRVKKILFCVQKNVKSLKNTSVNIVDEGFNLPVKDPVMLNANE